MVQLFKKKKQNLLTYRNVSTENSLNEFEENSQSCPAKTRVLWQMWQNDQNEFWKEHNLIKQPTV